MAGGPPNVKPVAFLGLTAGIIGGPITGFVVGLMSMLISDIYFGAGYWTHHRLRIHGRHWIPCWAILEQTSKDNKG